MYLRSTHMPRTDPRSFLPLSPLAFQVMLALAGDDLHGYAVIQEVNERTDGVLRLRTGTLYTLLQRLVEEGLVEPGRSRPVRDPDDDPRRRYYHLTKLGRDVVAAEARRLEQALAEARRKRVIGKATRA